jgi:hypothetical protein
MKVLQGWPTYVNDYILLYGHFLVESTLRRWTIGTLNQCSQFLSRPNMIGDSRSHCWRHDAQNERGKNDPLPKSG